MILHSLKQINDVALILDGERTVQSDAYRTQGIHFSSEIAKFQGQSLAEVYGYLIAQHLGVRTPQMQGFTCPTGGQICGTTFFPNRVGLFIEDLGREKMVEHLGCEEAARRDPEQVAKGLVLSVFGAGDGVQILHPPAGQVTFIDLDLQCLFGVNCEDMVGRDLSHIIEMQVEPDDRFVESFYSKAVGLGVETIWLDTAKGLVAGEPPDLSISGHPDAEDLNKIARTRLQSLLLGLEMWMDIRGL